MDQLVINANDIEVCKYRGLQVSALTVVWLCDRAWLWLLLSGLLWIPSCLAQCLNLSPPPAFKGIFPRLIDW